MGIFDRSNSTSRTTRQVPIIVAAALLVVGIFVSVGVSYLQFRTEAARVRETVAIELNRLRGKLNVELQSSIYLTQGLVSLIKTQGRISNAEFDAFADDIVSQRGTIRDVAVAPGGIVSYVFPRRGNEGIIGVNFRDIPSQWRTVARAIEERRIVVAGPVALVQGGVGIIARVPVFLDNTDGPGSTYWGIISTVIDFPALIAAAGLDRAEATMRVALRGTDGLGPDGAVFWGSSRIFEEDPVNLDIVLPSGSWQIAAVPPDGWAKFNAPRSLYFYAGCALSLLLSLLLFQVMSANRALRTEVVERQNAEADARERERYSRNLIEASVDPFMVVGPSGEVQDVNGAMELVAGRPRAELVGSRFPTLFADSERAQEGLDRVWRESSLRDYQLSIRRPDGVEVHIRCNASLYRDDEAVRGVFVVARDETEREKSDAALQSERQRLLDVVEFFPEPTFIIDREGRVRAWNHAIELLTGIKAEEILGEGDYAYAIPFAGSRSPILVDLLDTYAEDQEARYKYVRRTADAIYAESFVASFRAGQGAHLWAVAAPLKDQNGVRFGSIEVIRDITDLMETETALRQAVSLQHAVLDATADGILGVDNANAIVSYNHKFVDLWQIPESVLTPRRDGAILGHILSKVKDPEFFMASIRDVVAGGNPSSQELIELKDGRIFERYSLPQMLDGRIVGRVWTFRDETERIRAAEQLTESVREKDVLLREIHHRVKNNLQVVVSLLSLQSSRIRDPHDIEILNASKNRVLTMALIHEVLYQNENFASIRMDDYVLRLVSKIQNTYGTAAANVRIVSDIGQLELDIEHALPCALIINELASNSLKYGFDAGANGTIRLSMSADTIRHCTLVVEDDGKGYAPDPDRPVASFGLMMVDLLVRQIRGELTVDASHGTRTQIRFPMSADSDEGYRSAEAGQTIESIDSN